MCDIASQIQPMLQGWCPSNAALPRMIPSQQYPPLDFLPEASMLSAEQVDSLDIFSPSTSGSKVGYPTQNPHLESLWARNENPVAITSQRRQHSEPLPLHIRAVDTPFQSDWSGGYMASEQVCSDPFSQEGMDPVVQAMMMANEDISHFRTQQSSSPFYPVCGAANRATLGEQGQQHSTPQPITGSRPGAGLEWTEPLESSGRWHTSHVHTVDAPLVHDLVGQAGQAVVESWDGTSFMVAVQTQGCLLKGVMHCQEMKIPTEVEGTAELRVQTARHSEEDNLAASRWWIENPGLPLLAVDSRPVTSKLSRDPFAAERGPPSYAPSGGEEQVSLDQWRIPPAPSGGICAALAAAKASAAAVAAAMEMPWMSNGGELPDAEDVAALSTRRSLDLLLNTRSSHPVVDHPYLSTGSSIITPGITMPELSPPAKKVKQSLAEVCSHRSYEHQAALMTDGDSMQCELPLLAGPATLKEWRLDAEPLLSQGYTFSPDTPMGPSFACSPPAESPMSGSSVAHKWNLLTGVRNHNQAPSQPPQSNGDYNGMGESPWMVQDTNPLSSSVLLKRSYSSISQLAAESVLPPLPPIKMPHGGDPSSNSIVAAMLMPSLLYQCPQQQQQHLSQLSAQTPHNFPSQSITTPEMGHTFLPDQLLPLCQSLDGRMGALKSKVPHSKMACSSAQSPSRQAGTRPSLPSGPDIEGGSICLTHALPHGVIWTCTG